MEISNLSLILSSSLVFIALLFSYFQKLNLEKDIIISMVRATIQLLIVGYFLEYIFNLKSIYTTTIIVLFMIINASLTASKRAKEIKHSVLISFFSIFSATLITLFILIITKSIKYIPSQVIPISGMIISNSMIAIGLCYKNLIKSFNENTLKIETKLSLGANLLQASKDIITDSIKISLIPNIDSFKTLGIVSLPGMMTGLILAGSSPIIAVKYQIMVTFMILSASSISSFIAAYTSYKSFFNDRHQLIQKK